MYSVGENIRRRREQLRLTQAELAADVGVSRVTMGSYEGGSELGVSRLQSIARALFCDASDLLDPEWDCPPPHPSFGEVGP